MNFTNNNNLSIGLSERKDGQMKSSLKNRLLFFKNHNLDSKIIISAGLIHKNRITIVDDISHNQLIPNCDALITNQSKYLLTITVSDCLPIYFYDKHKKVIALAHAGWRGILSEIAKEVIKVFVNHYNSNLNDIEIFIGPHIRDCHFEVKNDVANQFKPSDCITKDGKIYINLSSVINNQLLQLGINNKNISISEDCTYCSNNKYFSHRRDKQRRLETMIAYLGMQ